MKKLNRYTFLIIGLFLSFKSYALPSNTNTTISSSLDSGLSGFVLVVSSVLFLALIAFGVGVVIGWLNGSNNKPAEKTRFFYMRY